MEIGILGAVMGGFLTLLSPCSVMLLPAFFSYAFTSPSALLARTGIFYLGLITTLVPLGALAGTVGAFVNAHRSTVMLVAAAIVVLLGFAMLANVRLPSTFSYQTDPLGSTASVAVYTLGTVYGLAGVCAGPILGTVLTLAAVSGSALYGGITLVVYAMGMVLPLFVLGVLWVRLPVVRNLVRPREVRIGRWHNTWTGVIGGVLTCVIGVALLLNNGSHDLGGVLSASEQIGIEGWVQRYFGVIPDALVVGASVSIALIAVVVARSRRRKQSRRNLDPSIPLESDR